MELTQDMIIDLALNVTGYLVAAALSLVLYSLFKRTPRAAGETSTDTQTNTEKAPRPARRPEKAPAREREDGRRSVQFVGFGGEAKQSAGGEDGSLRRNRADVLRLARTMMRDGKSSGEIKAALPVSDAELAVLDYERK